MLYFVLRDNDETARNEVGMNIIRKKKRIFCMLFGTMILVLSSTILFAATKRPKKPSYVTATAVKTNVNITWRKASYATRYAVYQYNPSKKSYTYKGYTKSCKYTVKNLKRGETYQFKVRGYRIVSKKRYYGSYSKSVSATISKKGYSTLKNYLKSALAPCGSTMYIWGGGWNKADTSAGKDAKTIGVNPNWRTFFGKQKKNYNTSKTRYQWGNGLDCSGFVGWSIYNIRNTANNKSGYVMSSKKMAKNFASRKWGTYQKPSKVKNYKPGDIMSTACSDCSGHVWIVIGQCSDGSVVLLHSSAPGVQLSGTQTRSGSNNSQAIKLAKQYMKKYYPSWYKKYPSNKRSKKYLSHFGQMRWNTGNSSTMMTDPDGYQNMNAQQVLKDLFS